jgi:hypothetical protein
MNVTIKNSHKAILESDLRKLESRMRAKLPPAYRKFLRSHNGGIPTPDLFSTRDGKIDSIVRNFLPLDSDDEESLTSEFEEFTLEKQIPSNIIPIAIDPADDRIVLSLFGRDAGSIYYWARGQEPDPPSCSYKYMYLIADSFEEFLSYLHE